MIYTLTLNPSLDYLMDVNGLQLGKTNRSSGTSISFGGKGINVSYVLEQLGCKSVCLGICAGFTGEELQRLLKQENLTCDFVKSKTGNTRINVKLSDTDITEINAAGQEICPEDEEKLLSKLSKASREDTVVVSGSIPTGGEGLYERVLKLVTEKGARLVVDTSGEMLVKALNYKPFLIKPNIDELSHFAEKNLENTEDVVSAAKRLRQMGALNVLVSMGHKGAVLVDENDKVYYQKAFEIDAVNTVGAGDSMVAGFLFGLDKGYEYALKMGNACGAASAASITLAKKDKINEFLSL